MHLLWPMAGWRAEHLIEYGAALVYARLERLLGLCCPCVPGVELMLACKSCGKLTLSG